MSVRFDDILSFAPLSSTFFSSYGDGLNTILHFNGNYTSVVYYDPIQHRIYPPRIDIPNDVLELIAMKDLSSWCSIVTLNTYLAEFGKKNLEKMLEKHAVEKTTTQNAYISANGLMRLEEYIWEKYKELPGGIRHGLYTQYGTRGQILEEGMYKLGQQDGIWRQWTYTGKKMHEGAYKNGKKEGLWKFWFANDVKETEEGMYKDGKKEGIWAKWTSDGKKLEEGTYKSGRKDGTWTFWYASGATQNQVNYQNGTLDGLSIEFYEDGRVKRKITYVKGKRMR